MRWLTVACSLLIGLLVETSFAQAPVAQKVEHLGFNVTIAPLDNVTLRQAIVSAINRQAVFEVAKRKAPSGWVIPGPAGSWFPPYLRQHRSEIQILPYDVSTAKLLLAKAGFPGGEGLPEFEILYRQDPPFGAFRQAEAEALKAQLMAIGIRARTLGLPSGEAVFDRITPGPGHLYQMVLFAWGATKPEDDFLIPMFLPGSKRNVYGYRNAEVTLRLAEIQKEKDAVKRVGILQEVERLVLTDAPVVPLFYYYAP